MSEKEDFKSALTKQMIVFNEIVENYINSRYHICEFLKAHMIVIYCDEDGDLAIHRTKQ